MKCSTYEEYYSKYLQKEPDKNYRLFFEGSFLTKKSLRKALQSEGKELDSYLLDRLERPKCGNPKCENLAKTISVSNGYAKTCCKACGKSTLAYVESHREAIKLTEEGRSKIDYSKIGQASTRNPNSRLSRNLHNFRDRDSAILYVVTGKGYCKFGMTVSQSRVDQKAKLVEASDIYMITLPKELCCSIEAFMIEVGEDVSEVFSGVGGETEFRESKYSEQLKEFVRDRI